MVSQRHFVEHIFLKEGWKRRIGYDRLLNEFGLKGWGILKSAGLLIHVAPVGLNQVIDDLLPP